MMVRRQITVPVGAVEAVGPRSGKILARHVDSEPLALALALARGMIAA